MQQLPAGSSRPFLLPVGNLRQAQHYLPQVPNTAQQLEQLKVFLLNLPVFFIVCAWNSGLIRIQNG